jgi:hypothetical protein
MTNTRIRMFKSKKQDLLSKQDDNIFKNITGVIEPQFDFSSMLYAYDNDPIIS